MSKKKEPITNVVVKLSGKDGNAFSVLGAVSKALRKAGHEKEADEFYEEATQGNYDHLLRTCFKYVFVE